MSIVSMITNAITPTIADQVGKKFGLSGAQVQMGLKAVIPTILAAILGKAQSGAGANAFSNLLSHQASGQFDNIAANVARDTGALSANGLNALKELLGDGATDQLTSKLGSFANLTGQNAGQLLGVGSATVMGALGKLSKDKGIDAANVLNHLAREKDDIARAIPADLAKSLTGTGLLDGVPDTLAEARTTASVSAKKAAQSVHERRSWWPWVAAAVAVLAAFAFLPNFFAEDEPAEISNVELTSAPTDVDTFTKALNDDLGTLSETLGGISDPESAEAALPALRDIESQISALGSQFGALPEEAQSTVSDLVSSAMPQVTQTIESLLSDGSIGNVVKPVFDGIVASLNNLTAS